MHSLQEDSRANAPNMRKGSIKSSNNVPSASSSAIPTQSTVAASFGPEHSFLNFSERMFARRGGESGGGREKRDVR